MATAYPNAWDNNGEDGIHLNLTGSTIGSMKMETADKNHDSISIIGLDNHHDSDLDPLSNQTETGAEDTTCQSEPDFEVESKLEDNYNDLRNEILGLKPESYDVAMENNACETQQNLTSTNAVGDVVPKIEAYSVSATEAETVANGILHHNRLNQLQGEVNQLTELLNAKETEWNGILRLKKLKEILLTQLKRKIDVTKEEESVKPEDEVSNLVTSQFVQDILKPDPDVCEDNMETDSKTEEASFVQLEPKIDHSTTVLPQSSPQLAAALNGLSSKVQNNRTSTAAKRKSDTAEQMTKKSKVSGTLIDAPSFNYSDVLVALAKISAHEQNLEAVNSNLTPVQSKPANSKSNPKPKLSSTVQYPKIPSLSDRFDSTLTLASLLADSAFCQTPPRSGGSPSISQGLPEPVHVEFAKPKAVTSKKKNGKVKKRKGKVNAVLTVNNELQIVASNQPVEYENESAAAVNTSAATTALCQYCNKKQALFVCAGCENQWYCDRACQSAAWVTHSDVCGRPKL